MQRNTTHVNLGRLHFMSRASFPIVLVLVALAALTAVFLPDIFGLITGLQDQPTGVSSSLSEVVGRIPLVLFVLVGIAFTAVLTVGSRR